MDSSTIEHRIRWYFHPEEDPRLFWLHPIWTQLVKERGLPGGRWANITDATSWDKVHLINDTIS